MNIRMGLLALSISAAALPAPGDPADGALLFSDDFSRTGALGSNWFVESGLWVTKGFAQSDLDGEDLAHTLVTCADCRVQSAVVGFGVPITGIYLREDTHRDRYELVLNQAGGLQIARYRGGIGTILAQAASGLPAPNEWTTLSFSVFGADPVTLIASVNGVERARVQDAAAERIVGAGFAGMHTTRAGVDWDTLRLYALATAQPDAGTPDAGPLPDAGTPDAGSCLPAFGTYGPGTWPPACWRPYSAASPFNRPIPANPPVHPSSNAIMARIFGDISADNGVENLVANLDGHSGEPTYYPKASDPVFTIHCTAKWGTCPLEGARVRIPAGAEVEAGAPANRKRSRNPDAHLTVIDQSTLREYDFWQVQVNPIPSIGGPLNISWGGLERIDGDGTAEAGSATGADVAELAGRIRIEELKAGRIDHALAIGINCGSDAFVYPAKKYDRRCSDIGLSNLNAPAMGSLLQLEMSAGEIDALPVPQWKKTILHAMASYGMYMTETGTRSFFALETEGGGMYKSLGYPDPWLQFALDNRWPYYGPDRNYVGDWTLDADGFAWMTVWSRLRVLDPCVATGTCR